MPHIFGFHKGHNANILGWEKSDRIVAGDISEIADKTDIVTSSAGSSIPTPIARLFLFKAAFEFMSAQILSTKKEEDKGIYAALVSETLDLLELIYKSGSNTNQLRYESWQFDEVDARFFGAEKGHQLLNESFRQSAAQSPYDHNMEITLIYYKEGNKEVLLGGTSPFTFVFTSPNFKRKLREKGMGKIYGLTSDEPLFTDNYKQLHERDSSFIWFAENLMAQASKKRTFEPFTNYVTNIRKQFEKTDPKRFDAENIELQHIQVNSDASLSVAGIFIEQISERNYQSKINSSSDFKLDLPSDSPYLRPVVTPLFLYSNMDLDGQYTSPSNYWSSKTMIKALDYPENTVREIEIRELPGIMGIQYPFLSKFDFFEKSLVMLPGYKLDDKRFECLIDDQDFLLPIKPLFFNFFPLHRLKEYVKITRNQIRAGSEPEITVQIDVPITGPTMGKRKIVLKQVYKRSPLAGSEEDKNKYPFIEYMGILGIFPFIKTTEEHIKYINKYTVAAYEKTSGGDPVSNIKFIKASGTETAAKFSPRSESEPEYTAVSTKTGYYQVDGSFELLQVNFTKDYETIGSLIVPKFKTVTNGTDSYVYGIDFGTSNTHIEYARVENKNAVDVKPFEINEKSQKNMVMTMLNKPVNVREQDGAVDYDDYNRFGSIIDSVKVIAQREFIPTQIGSQKGATVRFPFRTATFESRSFKESKQPKLFNDANIGFHIDRDLLVNIQGYQTNLKWELESNLNSELKQNRVKIFFRELLLMIRSHAILISEPSCKLDTLKIAMSFPISMDTDLKSDILKYFTEEMNDVFGIPTDDRNNARVIEVTESIAPYYQLLKDNSNIRHNIYGNIDVGGGTSDIVLVKNDKKNNILNCYCNSIKFAGKQLWGSLSEDDYNTDNNGFVLYFLQYLKSENIRDYNSLQNMVGKNHIEDVVSYLFYDERYNFKRIFSECKELKVPLLLHYAALLYFVAKTCKLKPLELPKTLSFSGKGSEYISILFNSDEHLRSFTKRALSVFSGLPADPEFGIKKSTNPKVITAQGSVIYGAKPLKKKDEDIFGSDSDITSSDEPLIYPIADKYYGLKDADSQQAGNMLYKNFQEGEPAYESVLSNCVEFLETFFGDEYLVKGSETSLGINNLGKYKSFFLPANANIFKNGVLRDSYLSALEPKDITKDVTDSPFFFAFNTSLIELSKFIAVDDLKKKGLMS